jgi:hypothetical protein
VLATVVLRTAAGVVLAATAAVAARHGGLWILLAVLCAILALWNVVFAGALAFVALREALDE